MDLSHFTEKAREAVLESQRLAQDSGHAAIEAAHILLALVRQPEGAVRAILARLAGGSELLRQDLEAWLQRQPRVSGASAQPNLARSSVEVLEAAQHKATAMKDEYVSTEHLLLALAEGPEAGRLKGFGVTPESILKALSTIRGSHRVVTTTPEDTYQALEKYGRDLTQLARQGWRLTGSVWRFRPKRATTCSPPATTRPTAPVPSSAPSNANFRTPWRSSSSPATSFRERRSASTWGATDWSSTTL